MALDSSDTSLVSSEFYEMVKHDNLHLASTEFIFRGVHTGTEMRSALALAFLGRSDEFAAGR